MIQLLPDVLFVKLHPHLILTNQLFLEDEGEAFQVKKSSFSRRIHKERKKNKSNDKSDKNISKNSQNSISHHENISYQSSSPSETKDTFVKEIQSDDGFSVRLLLFNFTIHLPIFCISSNSYSHSVSAVSREKTQFSIDRANERKCVKCRSCCLHSLILISSMGSISRLHRIRSKKQPRANIQMFS